MIQPKSFNTIKQPEGSRFCAAAVAAMATGKSLNHVLKTATMTPSRGAAHRLFMRTRHLVQYLAENGVIYGMILHDLPKMDGSEILEISYQQNQPAILTVPSTITNATHCVFWDGEVIRDPDPLVPETTLMEDYEVIEMVPLTYLDEDYEDDFGDDK